MQQRSGLKSINWWATYRKSKLYQNYDDDFCS